MKKWILDTGIWVVIITCLCIGSRVYAEDTNSDSGIHSQTITVCDPECRVVTIYTYN